MKGHLNNVYSKASNVFALLLISTSLNLNAQTFTDGTGGNNPVIQTVSSTNGESIVQVKWDNNSGERFAVVIKNKIGQILYSETFSDQKFEKRFRLPVNEDEGLILALRTLKGKTIQSYEINSNTRMVEELVIRKID